MIRKLTFGISQQLVPIQLKQQKKIAIFLLTKGRLGWPPKQLILTLLSWMISKLGKKWEKDNSDKSYWPGIKELALFVDSRL